MGHDLMGDIGEPLDGDVNLTPHGDDNPIDPNAFVRPGMEDDDEADDREIVGRPGQYEGQRGAAAAGESAEVDDDAVYDIPGLGQFSMGELREALSGGSEVVDELREKIEAMESRLGSPAQQQPQVHPEVAFMQSFLSDPQSRQAFDSLVRNELNRRGVPLQSMPGMTQPPGLRQPDPQMGAMMETVQRLDAFVRTQQMAQKEAELLQVDTELESRYGKEMYSPAIRQQVVREAYKLFNVRGFEEVFGPEHYRLVAEAVLARRGFRPQPQRSPGQQRSVQGQAPAPVRLVPGRSIRSAVAQPREESLGKMSDRRFVGWLTRALGGER